MLFDETYHNVMKQYNKNILLEKCQTPMEILEKYKDDDNTFVTFRGRVIATNETPRRIRDIRVWETEKIGINPFYIYDTPIGVYFYPIKSYWPIIEANQMPFAGNRPLMYVVKAKNPDKLLIGGDYSMEDYNRDKDTLQEIFGKKIPLDTFEELIDDEYKTSPAQTFWSLTRSIAEYIDKYGNTKSRTPIIWTQILRRFYDGVVDNTGRGFIHSNEPYQAVMWTTAQFDVVDFLDREKCFGTSYELSWSEEVYSDEKLARIFAKNPTNKKAWEMLEKIYKPKDIRYINEVEEKKEKFSVFLYQVPESSPAYLQLLKQMIEWYTFDDGRFTIPYVVFDALTKKYPNLKDIPHEIFQLLSRDSIENLMIKYRNARHLDIENDIIDIVKNGIKDPLKVPFLMTRNIAINIDLCYKYYKEILHNSNIPKEDMFDYGTFNSAYSGITHSLMADGAMATKVGEEFFNNQNLPPDLKKAVEEYKKENPVTENFLFDRQYKKLLESYQSDEMDLDKAYEIFNQEYLNSTGKSWSKDKFLSRARDWEFWGDENGFVTTRRQNSGYIKLVGAAGSDKSKYKGFKELIETNLPVWGMVDIKIAGLLKKMGYRGPNTLEKIMFQQLMASGRMNPVLGDGKVESIEGDKITITYPDIGTVEKYFMGSPQYWKKVSLFGGK